MMSRTPLSTARRAIFALIAIAAMLALAGIALSLWNLKVIRQRQRIRHAVRDRIDNISLGEFVKDMPPERRDHLRACYRRPEQTDLDKISWNLWCMPTPFVEYAPEPGRQVGGAINAQQMHDRRDVVMPKPAGVYRIFLTGGSYAFGAGASDEDALISSFLERELNALKAFGGRRVEVFNAAVPAWASTHERIRIENQLAELQPDLVIMLTGGNDAHWGMLGASALSFRAYDDDMVFTLANEALQLAGARLFPAAPPARLPKPLPPDEVARVFVRNVRLAAHALELAGARCVLAMQPTLSPAAKPLSPGEREWLDQYEEKGKVEYLAACFARIERLLDQGDARLNANLARVNVSDAFRERPDPIFFDLFHTGDKGNEIVALRMAAELERLFHN